MPRSRSTARALVPAALALLLASLPALADDLPAPPAPAAPEGPAAAPAAHAEATWVADFDKAVEQAKAEKKDLLVDFTGSGWCGWCTKLHEEVFSKPEFAAVRTDYVLVSLDFDQHGVGRGPTGTRSDALAKEHAIGGFPTILLMTSDGDVFGQTGYAPGGAGKYVEMLVKLRDAGRAPLIAAIEVAKEFDGAKDAARVAAAEKAVAMVEKAGEGSAWVAKLVPATRAAMDSDPENAKGLRLRAIKALLKNGGSDEALVTAAKTLDPKNEKGALELVVFAGLTQVRDEETCKAAAKSIEDLDALGPIKDAEVAQVLYANVAFWNHRIFDDQPKAKTYATKLKAVADPKNPKFADLIASIEGGRAAGPMGGAEDGEEEGDDEGHEGPEGGK